MVEQACVSVIIPCYCCSDTIGRAVASVAKQTLLPAELILVEDCSGDNTLATLYCIQSNYPGGWIKVIVSAENSGPGTARNIGWELAAQPYIAFLDSDDSWHPKKIEMQYGWMENNSDVALTGHAFRQFYGKDAIRDEGVFSIDDSDFYPVNKMNLLLSNRFSTPSVMLRRNIIQRFPSGKRYSEDYQLWLEICCAGLKCYRSDLPLTYLYKAAYGDAGLSAALWKMEKGELDMYRSLFNLGLIKFGALVPLVGWSLLKFLRRAVIVALAKVR